MHDWVDKYMLEHADAQINVREFRLSDEDYADFVQFIADKDVVYESESRRQLKLLQEALQREHYDEALSGEFTQLGDLIKDDKMSNMQTYRREIEDMLVIEILTRYAYNAAACENSSCKDEGVARAIDLILNSEEYSRILREQDLGMH
jgi:carboxyl-terminal processing protease